MSKPRDVRIETEQFVVVSIEDLVPNDHFLRRLAELMPWKRLAAPFEACFKGGKEYGPHGYPVSMLLKMTVLSYLFNMSDPQTERFVKENIPARLFVGLSLLQPVPDATTLCRFRGRIVKDGKSDLLKQLFDEVLALAQRKGIEMGKVQVLDAVHTESKIDKSKEDRGKKTEEEGDKPRPPKDPDATWGCKGKQKKKDPETGETYEHKKYFYGYKSHVSLNQKTGLVTSLLFSTGKDADCTAAPFLVNDDINKNLKPTVLTADKAYDDVELHVLCGKHDIFNAVALKDTRTKQKSAKIRQKWEEHKKLPYYKKALAIRYKIEQKFGEAKQYHGLRKCRYCGLIKLAFQSTMTFLCLNLKRMVKLLPIAT